MARYTHGHHESVLRSHRWRTAQNSAAYVLPSMHAGMLVLDVGCGPGNITLDFARMVHPQGRVVGIDAAPEIIDSAREAAASSGLSNVSFAVGDVYAIDADDHAYDVVHAHQLLQHLAEPVTALREMRRACRLDGVVAARDADYAAMTWYPPSEGLTHWLRLYRQLARHNQGEPDAGRMLMSWAIAAGFSDVAPSASVWCFANQTDRRWWGALWAERVVSSAFAQQAVESGLATTDELAAISVAWLAWAEKDDAWFAVLHGEVLCRN